LIGSAFSIEFTRGRGLVSGMDPLPLRDEQGANKMLVVCYSNFHTCYFKLHPSSYVLRYQ